MAPSKFYYLKDSLALAVLGLISQVGPGMQAGKLLKGGSGVGLRRMWVMQHIVSWCKALPCASKAEGGDGRQRRRERNSSSVGRTCALSNRLS